MASDAAALLKTSQLKQSTLHRVSAHYVSPQKHTINSNAWASLRPPHAHEIIVALPFVNQAVICDWCQQEALLLSLPVLNVKVVVLGQALED